MRNLVKYAGIGLLVMGLAACDNNDTKASAESAAAESRLRSAHQPDGWQTQFLTAGGYDRSKR